MLRFALRLVAFSVLTLSLDPSPVAADGLIPGPGESGHDPALQALALQYDRQFHLFNASPFGLSLDAFVPIESDRMLVSAFMAQSATDDFAAFTAGRGNRRTVADVISQFGEYGDLGMFGGVPGAGEAYRYMVLRDRGAPLNRVAEARADLLEAIESFHIYMAVTGSPGSVARGIRRAGAVGTPLVPFPASCPDPWDREPELYHVDQSGQLPGWEFKDNTSKDQVLGYVFALGAFWDAVASDPSVPDAVRQTLQADARAMGQALMTPQRVSRTQSIDLVITGAGGCVVRFHDLNPRELRIDGSPSIVVSETSTRQNGFNALAALGIIRTLYHVSGDATLGSYYYDELVGRRGYPALIASGIARVQNMFANACVSGNCVETNFSNVNMAVTAIFGVLRYETDAALRTTYRQALESELWTGPKPHMLAEIQQAFYSVIYNAFRAGGADAAVNAAISGQLVEWPQPPYFSPAVINCDGAEIAAGTCVATDGVTQITLDDVARRAGGEPRSVDPLPRRLRPPSNFEWRSDPRRVNGAAGVRLNPGGDFRGAYWMGRGLQSGGSVDRNVSPHARNRDGTGGPMQPSPPDAGVFMDAEGLDAAAADATEDAGFDASADAGPVDPADTGAPPMDTGVALDAGQVDASLPADSGMGPGPIVDGGTLVLDAGLGDATVASDTNVEGTAGPEGGCGCSTTRSRSTRRAFSAPGRTPAHGDLGSTLGAWALAFGVLLRRRRRDSPAPRVAPSRGR